MNHYATAEFWRHYQRLPEAVQAVADKNFQLLKADPTHPSLQFKKIGRLWSVRVGLRYRALGTDRADGVAWFWIGPHTEYDRLLS